MNPAEAYRAAYTPLLQLTMATQSFAGAHSDAEMQMTAAGFSTALWTPEFGWSSTEAEASEDSHAPQLLAAMQCFLQFFVAQTLRAWVHLAAEMQAGKTGVVTALIRLMLANARRLRITPDRIFIITGMSDNAWVKQTKDRVPSGVRSGVQHSGGLLKVIGALKSLAAAGPLANVLIVLDESHIASSTGNRPSMVYSEVVLLCPREKWAESNIRFLTISATDPAKGLVMAAAECPISARVVRLQTNDAYQSVESLHQAGRIRATESLVVSAKANPRAIAQLKRDVMAFDRPRYHIIRPSHGKQAQAESVLAEAFPGCSIMPWDSSSRPDASTDEASSVKLEDINLLLEVQPSVHTFILLKNMFYASKTMDDTHVGVLYDRVGGKDDTNLQSLLGRACGYGKSKATIVYTSEQTVTNYLGFWREVIAGGPAPLTEIPVSRLDKKMAGQRVESRVAGAAPALPVARTYATPAGGGGSVLVSQEKKREKKNEDDYEATWKEFPTFEAAKVWAKGVHKPSVKDGFFQTSTTKGPEVLRYDQVMAMKGGKKTANLPKTEVGKTVHRLYVGYKDMANPNTAVFVIRRVTRLR